MLYQRFPTQGMLLITVPYRVPAGLLRMHCGAINMEYCSRHAVKGSVLMHCMDVLADVNATRRFSSAPSPQVSTRDALQVLPRDARHAPGRLQIRTWSPTADAWAIIYADFTEVM